MAQPARHLKEAGKLYLPAIQSSASLQKGARLKQRWSEESRQVTGYPLSSLA
jgi:hypothetical protein